MSDGLLSIGAFSRASSISVRTLRNYHEAGLLVPASVDPRTGYRCYSVDQLADALVIVRLRSLDVPLVDVHRILGARDPAVTAEVLRGHEATMLARLSEVERIVGELQSGLPAASTPVHVVDGEPMHVVEVHRSTPSAELWGWIEHAAAQLVELAGARRRSDEPVSALYTASLDDESVEDVTVFVAIDEPFLVPPNPDGCRIGELPAQRWASLVHTEGFASIGETYRLLGAWVGRNAAPADDGRILERYPRLLGGGVPDAVIELRWPID